GGGRGGGRRGGARAVGGGGGVWDMGERGGGGGRQCGGAGEEVVGGWGRVGRVVGCGFHVHGAGLGIAFLEDDFRFRFALGANRRRPAFGFGNQPLLLGGGESLNALPLDFCWLEHGRNQFGLETIDFRFLNFDLLLFFY